MTTYGAARAGDVLEFSLAQPEALIRRSRARLLYPEGNPIELWELQAGGRAGRVSATLVDVQPFRQPQGSVEAFHWI